ncbi:extracellular matrix protein FRAS1 [Osmerus mordax]|uniref:extracellular matrix protein FRAS1 n=1 Tax=Osmerus mordax TaxID=8014 RepID=UPI003510C7E7
MSLRWILLAALAGIITITPGTQGACVHQGSQYQNNSTWRPQSCEECSCYGDVAVCTPARCPNPQCDFKRGEKLRIPPSRCCPECLAPSPGACQHEGDVYGDGSQWSVSLCSVCVCSLGRVSCSPPPCPPLSCLAGQSPFTPAGECCPKCAPHGASCSWEGGDYRSGEEWTVGPCSRCVCRDGQAECSTAECQPVVCSSQENLVIQPGSCCPQCEADPCLSAGKQYQHGEHWQKNSCTTCACERGQSRCHTLTCPPVTCEKGQTKVKRAGRCCDECAVAKGSCLYKGVVRYHGDMWKGAGCEFCSCERGQVLCQQAQCAQVNCPQGEVVVQVPGQCCPECSSSSASCGRPQEEQRSRGPKLLAGSERWSDGPCRECECREGRVTCYRPSCPSCPPGTLTVPREGRCCPECSHERCHEDCLVCSGSAEQCEVCRDPSALLLHGRCLLSCPPRYHALGRGCAACQSSCATCESSFECSSCGGSSVLSSRQCVNTCEPGLYRDHTRCLRCHESCSECVGPGPEECVSCSSPALLLREGVCVSDCGPGFYTQRGICYACDPSCASCYPDNPKCMSCPPGFALHHGKCVSDCLEGHYLESDSRCRACPGSCSSCSGPGGSQCSRCPDGRSLSGGRCVEACGEGLYPQDGACHSCHVSCRVCLGPGPSGCLACRKPEEALLPQGAAGGGGVCVSGCTARHYLDASHTCRECHTSCLQCMGGSAHNCTSCSAPFILHDDQCVSECPQGFHVQDNTCLACHPSCPSCSGPSQADCQACAPQSSLHNGYCRTRCPEGHYLGPDGSCQACSEGCQRCTADLQTRVGSVCLWCQVPRTLLLGDHCVSACPPGRYAWHGACRRCHPSCEACSGEGPLSCTSCPTPMVLLPSGLCSASCPRGYYANGDRVCNACDPPCLSCEAAGACRSCRDPSQVLLFGECQDSCAQQYYLNTTTRACTECDWSCNSCRGPLVSDCLQCMEGLVLLEGMCSQACSPGSYQHGDTCLRCEEDCEQCQGPGVCERCQAPLVLRQGRCVAGCGRNFFLDASMQLCTPCAKDCVECEEEGLCRVCRYHAYLRDGRCVPDCGRGYYADKKTMTCYVNTHAPTLRVNGTLLVPLEGMVPLPPSLLSTQGPPGPLSLQLLQPPSSGRLVVVDGGGERPLARDDSFSWAQLQGGAVRFSQDKDKPRSGEFTLRVADLQPSSRLRLSMCRQCPCSDVSSLASVWCATRPSSPPSATPGVDYIPSSKKVEFRPGTTQETCSLTIVDDIQSPAIEGSESFIVFLSSPQGAVLLEPSQADVVITDSFQDIPSMQFEKTSYVVKERDSVLHIPVLRSGDLAVTSSVRCFTRTSSAMVMDDFQERRNADESRITFLKGEKVKNCTVHINDDSVFEPEEEFQVHLGTPLGDHWTGAMVGVSDVVTVTITNDEDAPTVQFEQASYQVREPPGPDGVEVLSIKVFRRGDQDRTSKVRCSTRDGSAQSGIDYNPKSRVLKFTPGMDHILFKVEILSNEDREWHESFSLVLGPDDPVEAVLGEITTATVTILDQEAAGSLILPATPIVVSLADYDSVQEVTKEGSKKTASPGYPLVCVTPCDPHYPGFPVTRQRCEEAGINQTSVHFSWEVAAPTDASGARSPFETVTDNTPFTSVNHMVLDSIYFSRRFHVRCVAQARDRAGHLGTPLRSNIATIGTDGSICHTPVTTGTARGFQAQSFIATLKYLDVKHKEHPNRIHISVQIPHQDGMLPLVSTMPLHNLHFLLSESIYRQQHVCSNLVTLKDLQGISEAGFLDDVSFDSISLGPGYDRPYQFNPSVREPRSLQLYKHLNLKNCIWTFDAYYDMTELIDVCGGSVTADFQVRDSAQSFLTVQVPLHVSYIYVTAPRGWASLEHHTEMEFSFFYDTVLWRTGIQTDSVLSARLQIIRIYIKEDGRLVIEFKTHAKFRGQFVPEHHTLPGHKSQLLAPDHLGGVEFHLQLLWSAQSFDSPYQLWRATSSYSRKDYSGEYTMFLIPCTAQPTQPWLDPGDKPLSCTAHAPEKFLVPIAFQQTNRPVPVVYSLNTEFQLCNNEKIFMLDPASADVSMAEMDYKGAFSMGQTLYGRVLWNPEQNLNAAYKLQLEKVYLCTGRDGYVPFFDPTGTLYNEGPQYGCIQPNKHLKHRFLLLDRKQPDVCDRYFHDVPFEANFASDVPDLQAMTGMPGVDGFTLKVDALYKVEAGHQWYLQVIYVIGPESISGPRIQRSLSYQLARAHGNTGAHGNGRPRRDLVDRSGRLTLDESLIYDNEGDQVKNGTNMKTLRLEVEASATFNPQLGSSVGGGIAAVTLLVLVLLAFCLLFRKCRRSGRRKKSAPKMAEEYPLNTKVEVCLEKCLEKNFSTKHCTVRNINILNRTQDISGKVNGKVNAGVKVKQVNLEVKLQNNLNDGTEV